MEFRSPDDFVSKGCFNPRIVVFPNFNQSNFRIFSRLLVYFAMTSFAQQDQIMRRCAIQGGCQGLPSRPNVGQRNDVGIIAQPCFFAELVLNEHLSTALVAAPA